MAVLAVFVGYLLGNWLIQMVTGDTDTHQVMEDKIIEEEIVEDSKDGEDIKDSRDKSQNEDESSIMIKDEQNVGEQIKGDVFVIQVGAFQNYNNAADLKSELENKGFQVIVTDTSPYKVQLGATTEREEAEATEDKVESIGYNAFITH